jgi:hypothetical protein
MGALDTAKEFVRIGSTAGLSKDVIDLLEKKAALLAEQVSSLERENAQLKAENAKFRHQADESGDKCPYCRRTTGQLQDIKPHQYLGAAGLKVGYYKCANPSCGKTYDKEMES